MKYVLVTGGAGGLGQCVARYFASKGYRVFVCDIKKTSYKQNNLISIAMDIRNMNSVMSAFKKVRKHTDHLDAVVNCAGIYNMDSLVEIGESDFTNIFNINLIGAYRVNKAMLPLLQNGGRIIIITSEVAALKPLPFNGLYSITKIALESYAHSLRLELSLIGIPVITVRPGAFKTRILNNADKAMRRMCKNTELYKTSASRFETIMHRVMSKAMKPEHLAKIIYKSVTDEHYSYVYKINANPLLKLANLLPDRLMIWALKRLLN